MPNIKKMKKNRDLEGLTRLIGDEKPKVRVNAAQALKDIGDMEAIKALTDALFNTIKFRKNNDQIEAMIIMQGRVPASYVEKTFTTQEQIDALKNVHGPLPLNFVQGPMEEMIRDKKISFINGWFGLLTLVELGDHREELLEKLITLSIDSIVVMDRTLISDSDNMINFILANGVNCLIEETIRALASFKDNSTATKTIIMILDGELFRGSYVHRYSSYPYLHAEQKHLIYALSAIGDPSERERIEYLANRGDKSIRKTAKAALRLYGKATYDEIKAKVESKKK